MRTTVAIVSMLVGALVLPAAVGAQPLAFTDVTVVDGTGGAPQHHVTVVVADGRIATIASTATAAVPPGAQVVNGAGKVLIPGLWDMHVHLLACGETALPLLIANGVTGVRDMGGNLAVTQRWRQRIRAGSLVGPRIVAAGPILDGPQARGARGRLAVTTAEEGTQAVAQLKDSGVDFIKTHSLLPRDAYFAIAAEARRQGLDFCGHVPDEVTLDEAIAAGQKTIEHLVGVPLACSTREAALRRQLHQEDQALDKTARSLGAYVDARLRVDSAALRTYSPAKAAGVFARLAQHRVWQCPTLVTLRAATQPNAPHPLRDPRLKYLPSSLRAPDDPRPAARGAGAKTASQGDRLFAKRLAMVGGMRRAGVEFLTGTDLGYKDILPGFSLHDELELLVRAGLTPMEALQAATLNAARVLGLERTLGTIEAGKAADLVLLDADPLDDIRNTTRIRAVVVNGRLLDRAALDKLLADAEAAARRS